MHEDHEVWNRVRQRLTSPNIILVRETLRLIDLPQCDAATAIAPLLASEDAGRLRALFTLLANISQNLLVRSGDPSPRQQTATLLANLLGDRIKAVGHATRTLTPSALAKQAAYVELSGRLIPLGDWTASSQAAAEQIITDLEKLRAVDPPGFLDVELGEAIAIAWVGIADHLQEAATFPKAIDAYGRAIEDLCQAMRPRSVMSRRCRSRCVGSVPDGHLTAEFISDVTR